MEVQLMEHIRHTLTLDGNKDLIIEKLLSLTLEIIHLLTNEDFVVVRKSHDHLKDGSAPSTPDRRSRTASPMVEPPTLSEAEDSSYDPMDLQPVTTTHEKPKKVAVKCEETSGGLSPVDWERSVVQTDSDVCVRPPGSVGGGRERRAAESCGSAPCAAGCNERIMTPDYQQYLYSESYNLQMSPQQLKEGAWIYPQPCKQEDTGHMTSGGCSQRNVSESCGSDPYPQDCTDSDVQTEDYQVKVGDGTVHFKEEEAAPDYISADHSEVEVKLYHCPECDECFTELSDFSFHQQAHSGSHLFSCAICRVSFKSESTFLKHQRCHLDQPSSPRVADRSFVVRSTIVRYSGEKPFQCTECGRCFALKSTLVKHQRVHTGERPFVCRQCGRSFSQSCNLLRHKRRCAAIKMNSGLN